MSDLLEEDKLEGDKEEEGPFEGINISFKTVTQDELTVNEEPQQFISNNYSYTGFIPKAS